MNRGVVEQQQMMAGNSGWWNVNSLRQTPSQQPFHPLRSCTSSSMPSASWHESQNQLPESWSQLLMGGLNSEEDRCNFSGFQATKLENWEDHVLFPSSTSVHMAGVKQERSESSHALGLGHEEFQAIRPPWGQILLPTSPRSCVTSFSSNMLDFSSRKSEGKHQESDHSSECNSTVTGAPAKKAKVQSSSSQSTFKVRKEKLGDRITVLHQLVSPFGKTDTASVLLEALGYIRFLQSQIEALSSPYLGSASGSMSRPAQGERNCIFPEDPGQLLNDTCIKRSETHDKMGVENGAKKDLRSRGLCLVPLSCTVHIVNDNSADYWATNIGGAGLLR